MVMSDILEFGGGGGPQGGALIEDIIWKLLGNHLTVSLPATTHNVTDTSYKGSPLSFSMNHRKFGSASGLMQMPTENTAQDLGLNKSQKHLLNTYNTPTCQVLF